LLDEGELNTVRRELRHAARRTSHQRATGGSSIAQLTRHSRAGTLKQWSLPTS
jgi:hypothetical protein